MMHAPRSTALRVLALAGIAWTAALLSNLLASPARRMAWVGTVAPLPSFTPRTGSPAPPAQAPHPPAIHEPQGDRPDRPARPGGPRKAAPPSPVPPMAPEPGARSPIREIRGQEAWEAFQSGAPFLDARRSSEFAEGHVAGAWCVPVWESDVDDRLISFKAARRPGSEDPIVIYCSGGDCRDSHLLAAKLLNDGYFNLLIYRDGFPDWVAQGHPVEKGQR